MIANQGVAPGTLRIWRDRPYWPELKAVAFDGWWDGIDVAAAAHGAIVVGTAEALNGPNREELPLGDLTSDGLHFNSEGHQLVADLFIEADGL